MDDQEFSDWAGKEVSLNSDYLDCVLSASGQHCPGSCFSNGGMLDFWTSDPQESGGADYYRGHSEKTFLNRSRRSVFLLKGLSEEVT